MKVERGSYYYGKGLSKKKSEEIEVDELVWKLSLIRGCVDYDRCNERQEPFGCCDDCLKDAERIIRECKEQNIKISI